MLILGLDTLIHISTPPLFEVGFEVLHRNKPAKLSERNQKHFGVNDRIKPHWSILIIQGSS